MIEAFNLLFNLLWRQNLTEILADFCVNWQRSPGQPHQPMISWKPSTWLSILSSSLRDLRAAINPLHYPCDVSKASQTSNGSDNWTPLMNSEYCTESNIKSQAFNDSLVSLFDGKKTWNHEEYRVNGVLVVNSLINETASLIFHKSYWNCN